LLLLIFYIYSVLFTELFGELELSQNYFGSLTQSLFTCMQLMTMEWSDIAREVMAQKTWAWAPFLSYIAITGFIVFNLIVAVVCDAVAVIDREAKSERDGPFESDANKLLEDQERIYELSRQVAAMKKQQTKLCKAVVGLTDELQNALTELEKYQKPPDSSESGPLPSAEDRPLVTLTPMRVPTGTVGSAG
jgi:Ion transport protein